MGVGTVKVSSRRDIGEKLQGRVDKMERMLVGTAYDC